MLCRVRRRRLSISKAANLASLISLGTIENSAMSDGSLSGHVAIDRDVSLPEINQFTFSWFWRVAPCLESLWADLLWVSLPR